MDVKITRMGLLIMFCAIMLTFFPSSAQALEMEETTVYLGINYNTYNLNTFEEWVYTDYGDDETFPGGISFFLGARQYFSWTDFPPVGVGLELERMSVSYSDLDISLSNTGFLFSVAFPIFYLEDLVPGRYILTAGAGIYRASLVDREVDIGEIEGSYVGPGFKIGLEALFPIPEGMALGGRLNYRFSRPHSEGDLDFHGLEAGLQAELSF